MSFPSNEDQFYFSVLLHCINAAISCGYRTFQFVKLPINTIEVNLFNSFNLIRINYVEKGSDVVNRLFFSLCKSKMSKNILGKWTFIERYWQLIFEYPENFRRLAYIVCIHRKEFRFKSNASRWCIALWFRC